MRSVEEVFSGRLRLIVASFLGVVLGAVLITMLLSLLGRSSQGDVEQQIEYRHRFQRQPLRTEHFVLPTALPQEVVVPVRYREPQEEWSSEQIDAFLLDSRSLGLEYLRRENESQLQRMLDAIP